MGGRGGMGAPALQDRRGLSRNKSPLVTDEKAFSTGVAVVAEEETGSGSLRRRLTE